MMQISISPADFAPGRLLCLTSSLKNRYRHARLILVTIYDDQDAAVRDRPLTVEASAADFETASHMHAAYQYDSDKHEEHLSLYPDSREGRWGTKFYLPLAAPMFCTLEIDRRCLLRLDHIEYPWDAQDQGVSGNVTLTGLVSQGGTVSDLSVAESQVNPTQQAAVLERAARDNLKSWRFEPGPQSIPIRITFSYILVASPHFDKSTETEMALPSRVVIKANLVN